MSTLGEDIRTKLLNDPTVVALVGSRIFPLILPESTQLPAVVYLIISDTPENSFTGKPSDRRKNAMVQVDCYARAEHGSTAYAKAHEVADAVDNVLGGLTNPDLSGLLEVSRDLNDNVTTYFRVSMDFSIWR